jgi:hypothetical protein
MRLQSGVAIVTGLLAAGSASASPDGPEWTIADEPDGCGSCHLSEAETTETAGLELLGLPAAIEAGRQYILTVVLEDPALRNAGFLLTIRAGGADPGTLAASDDRVEVAGEQARSTWPGSFTDETGRARWQLLWTAPVTPLGGLRFEIWANAGNDDLSPLGDRLHHRVVATDSRQP